MGNFFSSNCGAIDDVIDDADYWRGPYGVLVYKDDDGIVANDGYNILYKDGSVTEKFMINAPQMNEKIYKQKYATLINGKYYYNKR